jgi:hypothetical protein
MNIIHRPSKVMQLRARLPTFIQLALQPTRDMIERQPTLPRGPDVPAAHTASAAQALRLHWKTPRNIVTPLRKRERSITVRLLGHPAEAEGEIVEGRTIRFGSRSERVGVDAVQRAQRPGHPVLRIRTRRGRPLCGG